MGERDMAMLNAAVCGLGWWGGRLVESVAGSNLIRFTRGYTRNPAAHAEFAESTGIAVGSSYDDILADPAIHAVVLATPHTQHDAQVIAAARAGKHVFVEKPFTLTRAGAEAAVAACRAAGVTLCVGFNRRWAPAYVEMVRRIRAGEIGELMHMEGQNSGPGGWKLKPGQWRADPVECPGGALTPRGVHTLDGMIHIGGPVSSVYALSQRHALPVAVDDNCSMLLKFAGGATGYLGSLNATGDQFRLQVYGSKGWLDMRSHTELASRGLEGTPTVVNLPALDIECAELEAFASAVAARTAFVIEPAEIINSSAVVEGVVQSVASGQPVAIAA